MGNVNMEANQIHYKGEETAKTMFEKLDLIAQQVGELPTFTSDDRAFLEKLPALPTAEGKTVLTAKTDDQGETNLSYAAPEVEGEDVAPEFSDAEAYSAGDLVFHDGILYKFTSDHAAGDWDATEATQTSVAGELSALNNTLSEVHDFYGSCKRVAFEIDTGGPNLWFFKSDNLHKDYFCIKFTSYGIVRIKNDNGTQTTKEVSWNS